MLQAKQSRKGLSVEDGKFFFELVPCTTALDQSSLEFSERILLDQSEFEDVKRLYLGWSGSSVISTSEPVFPPPVNASVKKRSLVP